MKYKRTSDIVSINNKNKYVYIQEGSNGKYVKHNKKYLTISDYKKMRGGVVDNIQQQNIQQLPTTRGYLEIEIAKINNQIKELNTKYNTLIRIINKYKQDQENFENQYIEYITKQN